jgi:hypothetical protein
MADRELADRHRPAAAEAPDDIALESLGFDGSPESAIAEPVFSLRAELAKMFDLPDDIGDDASAAVTQSPLPSPAVESAKEDGAEPEDSVAAYMERLLARTRRASESDGEYPVSEPASYPSPRAENLRESLVAPDDGSVSGNRATVAATARRRRSDRAIAPDKEAIREHLESFREVANVSARVALARHSWKTLKGTMLVKTILILLCLSAATMFYLASRLHHLHYTPQAVACFSFAVLIGAGLLKNLLDLRQTAIAKAADDSVKE